MLWQYISCLDMAVWIIIIAVGVFSFWLWSRGSNTKLPPSPGLALPIIGHLYIMEKNPRAQFMKWSKELGSLFHLKMGSTSVVVVSGMTALKDLLVKRADQFTDRPGIFINTRLKNAELGVLFSSGPLWKEQRIITLSVLKDFGVGKNVLADKISEEVNCYIEELEKAKGKSMDIKKFTTISVSNNICSILFGKRYDYSDPEFNRIMAALESSVKILGGTALLNFFPALQYLPFDLFGAKKVQENHEGFWEFAQTIVQRKKAQYDPDNIDSFVCGHMRETERRQKLSKSPTGVDETFKEENLVTVALNLFGAGTDTTSTTILWCILYILHHEHVQEKIYEEIVQHVGTERVPDMQDKPKLRYLQATIMETQRIASILPFSVQHVCSEDVTYNGYTIPAGTQILPNLDSVLNGQDVWGDPHNFRPERFLDEKGDIINREEFIPFSLGRRLCLGENLAKMELFLFLSAMFQRFHFRPADPRSLPPIREVFGITCGPESFQVRCVERKN